MQEAVVIAAHRLLSYVGYAFLTACALVMLYRLARRELGK